MGWRFWIDRGGTFTDLVGISPEGNYVVRKFLSEHPDLSKDPAIQNIRELINFTGSSPIPEGVVDEVRIGTTVATNALLEGTGKPVLLFCNKGFGDSLFIGDQHRSDLFSIQIKKHPFLATSVIEVDGRIDSNGNELEKLKLEQLTNNNIIRSNLAKQASCAICQMPRCTGQVVV